MPPLYSDIDYGPATPVDVSGYAPTLWESMGAAFGSAWNANPSATYARIPTLRGEQYLADAFSSDLADADVVNAIADGESPWQRQGLEESEQERRISEAGLAGKIKPDPGYSAEALDLVIENHRAEEQRQAIAARAPGWHTPFSLASSFAAGMLDPINIASAFIPVVGEQRMLSMLAANANSTIGRAMARAKVGALSGAVGAAVVEPVVAAGQNELQVDYGLTQSLLNVGFGAALGASLGPMAGGVGEWLRNRKGAPHPWSHLAPSEFGDSMIRANSERIAAARMAANPNQDFRLVSQQARQDALVLDQQLREMSRLSRKDLQTLYNETGFDLINGEAFRQRMDALDREAASIREEMAALAWRRQMAEGDTGLRFSDDPGAEAALASRLDMVEANIREAARADQAQLAMLGGDDSLLMAKYKSPAKSIEEFRKRAEAKDQNTPSSYYDFEGKIINRPQDIGDNYSIELGEKQLRHITNHHENFDAWNKISTCLEKGQIQELHIRHELKRQSYLFTLPASDGKLLAVIAAPMDSIRGGRRIKIQTAFEGTEKGLTNWLKNKGIAIRKGTGGSPVNPSPRQGGGVPLELMAIPGRDGITHGTGGSPVNPSPQEGGVIRGIPDDPAITRNESLANDGQGVNGNQPGQEIISSGTEKAASPHEANGSNSGQAEGGYPHRASNPHQPANVADNRSQPALDGDLNNPGDNMNAGNPGQDSELARRHGEVNSESMSQNKADNQTSSGSSDYPRNGQAGIGYPRDMSNPRHSANADDSLSQSALARDLNNAGDTLNAESPQPGSSLAQQPGQVNPTINHGAIMTEARSPLGVLDQQGDSLFSLGPGGHIMGAVTFAKDSRAIVRLFQSHDASTMLHEISHILRRQYARLAAEPDAPEALAGHCRRLEMEFGVEPGTAWTRAQEEAFAESFTAFCQRGLANPALQPAFAAIRQRMFELYGEADSANVPISQEARGALDNMMAGTYEEHYSKFMDALADINTRKWEQDFLPEQGGEPAPRPGEAPDSPQRLERLSSEAGEDLDRAIELYARDKPELAAELAAERDQERLEFQRQEALLAEQEKLMDELALCYWNAPG